MEFAQTRMWQAVKRWLQPAHPERERWSPHKTLNIVCAIAIAWMSLWMIVQHNWYIGAEGQVVGCLPWRYYVLTKHVPKTITKDDLYQYVSEDKPLIPNGLHVVKYVAGVPGDHVVVNKSGIYIDGKYWGPITARTMRMEHLSYASITKSYTIPPGKLLVLGTTSRTWDSRYWGLINASQVTARAYHLW